MFWAPARVQDLSTRHDWPVKNAIVDLPIRLKENSKRISGKSKSPLGAQNKDIGAASQTLLTRVRLRMRRRLGLAVTLLQILIVRPGNLLVKNHESLSINNESQLKKTRRPKLKMLGPLCNQTDNLETDAKTLHYSLLELKYSPSSTYLKHKKD